MLVISLERLRQENHEFQASLSYTANSKLAYTTKQDLISKKKKKEKK
jgi:hypothetical protein